MANITPQAHYLWRGIGGYFDTLSQIIAEFIDNSISNFAAKGAASRSILVRVEPQSGRFLVSVEDTGAGIADFEPCLRIGDTSSQDTPLNEHGFGLKHALASGNPDNDHWRISTRTKSDFDSGVYRRVQNPYQFEVKPETIKLSEHKWPGAFNGTGTIVEFTCSEHLFNTLQAGIKGKAKFTRCLDYLTEELGYIYADIIAAGGASITVKSDTEKYNQPVQAIRPKWVDFYPPKQGHTKKSFDGTSQTTLEYEFGEMAEGPYHRHYLKNMDTSGVEVRINGRLLADGIFKEIWGLEKHPSYNHFLVRLNLIADTRACLPRTRTAKNGIRPDDPILQGLFEWVRNTCKEPHNKPAAASHERHLVQDVEAKLRKFVTEKEALIQRDYEVFTSIGCPLPMDLFVFDGHKVTIYEAKKDNADVQAVYQLVMYWDGLVQDGKTPAQAILLASQFSDGVKHVIDMFNHRKDANDNPYRISTKTWYDMDVNYPPK